MYRDKLAELASEIAKDAVKEFMDRIIKGAQELDYEIWMYDLAETLGTKGPNASIMNAPEISERFTELLVLLNSVQNLVRTTNI